MTNTRYYQIADITIQVDSDQPITDKTFDKKFKTFRVENPGDDIITFHHHFQLPDISFIEFGIQRYSKPPWTIYEQPDGWLYLGKLPDQMVQKHWKIAKFSRDYTSGQIFHKGPESWKLGQLKALTTFPTDQIVLAPVLAGRQGFYLHSAGTILNGRGILFVGHSEAGKSTTTQMLLDAKMTNPQKLSIEILCDDRNIVRKKSDGWHVYGSWSHGDIPVVSAESAPLKAICFLEQSTSNEFTPLRSKQVIIHRLLACLIKSLETETWWDQTLNLVEDISTSVPCYLMKFDMSGDIIEKINGLSS